MSDTSDAEEVVCPHDECDTVNDAEGHRELLEIEDENLRKRAGTCPGCGEDITSALPGDVWDDHEPEVAD